MPKKNSFKLIHPNNASLKLLITKEEPNEKKLEQGKQIYLKNTKYSMVPPSCMGHFECKFRSSVQHSHATYENI